MTGGDVKQTAIHLLREKIKNEIPGGKMKKVLYFILLIAELFVGVLLMSALWNSSLYIPIAVAAVALLALQVRQIILYSKATDVAVKRKILLRIALIMLIPIAVFIVTYVGVAIMFVIAFA